MRHSREGFEDERIICDHNKKKKNLEEKMQAIIRKNKDGNGRTIVDTADSKDAAITFVKEVGCEDLTFVDFEELNEEDQLIASSIEKNE